MSRLAIAIVMTLAATAAHSQDAKPRQPQAPAIASADEARPFLFDGRMIGDGTRQNVPAGKSHPAKGAIVPIDKKSN